MRVLILLVSLTFSVNSFCQVVGFLGERFFINVHGGISPVLTKKNNDDILYSGLFNTTAIGVKFPISADISFVASNDVSLGIGITSTSTKANFSNCYFESDVLNRLFSSDVFYRTQIVHAYLEFRTSKSYSILGNYSRFGLARASFQNVRYINSSVKQNNIVVHTEIPDDVIALEPNQKENSLGLYYEVGTRIPLKTHFLITYGVYGYIFTKGTTRYTDATNTNFKNTESDTFIEDVGIMKMRFSNIFNLHLGLTFAF